MKLKDHKEDKYTWQAHTVMKVNEQCLANRKFPNGKVLTQKDVIETEEIIKTCKEVLIEAGCITNQLTLF
jgi:hypothetical protein